MTVVRLQPPQATARQATGADKEPMVAMLARAFAEDPVMAYMFPDEAVRQRKLVPLFRLLFKSNHALGGCDITGDSASGSMWRPPGHWHISSWDILRNIGQFIGVYGLMPRRVFAILDTMEKAHPKEPHWYLMVLGTDPASQGKGYGGITMRHRLAQIDAAHMPAYLEASRNTNVPLYARFGFEEMGAVTFPDGPTIYPMWRKAR